MKFNLIIVDYQYDFANPNGALYVPGAESAKDGIISFINKHHKDIEIVYFTKDVHPASHCSFKENGGQWPAHCVLGTNGANIDEDLINLCEHYHILYDFINKGTSSCKEEYGAFDNTYNRQQINEFDTSLFVICGIAGDYCVMETYKGLIKINSNFNVVLLDSGIASIDNEVYRQKCDELNALTI